MSQYVYVDGVIEYDGKKEVDTALAVLTNGGWLNKKNQFITEDGEIIIEENCVDYERNSLTIPGDTHRNLGGAIDELLIGAKGGFIHLNTDDGDLGFSVWNNGRWIDAWDYEEICCYLDDAADKEIILADEEEYDLPEGEDFWEVRNDSFNKAFYNAIGCFQSRDIALRYIPDKILVEVIHKEDRYKNIY